MRLFYFNDCIPKETCISLQELNLAFENVLSEYKNIKTAFYDEIDGIVTLTQLDKIFLIKNITLANCINNIVDRDLKKYGFSVFRKYPIENHFVDIENQLIDESKYELKLENENFDAFYLKIVHDHGGIVFSIGICDSLKSNSIVIESDKKTKFSIDNLFGQEDNTEYLKEQIQKTLIEKLNNLDKLKEVLDKRFSIYSQKFEKSFEKLSKELQVEIINGFKEVNYLKLKNENIPETLVNVVTPKRELKYQIKELKIRNPEAIRLYYSEHESIKYLASIEKKPLKDRRTSEQDNHIKNALSIIKQLIEIKN